MQLCECAVAVENALPMVQERADYVTAADHGAGVVELIDRIVATDLVELAPRLSRYDLLLGTRTDDEQPVHLKPYGANVLLTGSSGSGKSTIATAILERLDEQQYQFCIIDPEGDYESFEGTLVLGDPSRSPSVDAVMDLLEKPDQNAIVNLLGVGMADRPAFFEGLLPRLQELRARSGRPHWIVIDEAHHLLPTSWRPSSTTLPQELSGLMLITVHPDHVAPAVLSLIDTIVTVGEAPEQAIETFSAALERSRDAGEPLEARPPASRRGADLVEIEWRVAFPAAARPTARRAAPTPAQVRRGHPGRGQELLFPRPSGQAQPACPEPRVVQPDRGRGGRRDLALPSPSRRLLTLVSRGDQGRYARRRDSADRGTADRPRRKPHGDQGGDRGALYCARVGADRCGER